jgi:hypothetical protein
MLSNQEMEQKALEVNGLYVGKTIEVRELDGFDGDNSFTFVPHKDELPIICVVSPLHREDILQWNDDDVIDPILNVVTTDSRVQHLTSPWIYGASVHRDGTIEDVGFRVTEFAPTRGIMNAISNIFRKKS